MAYWANSDPTWLSLSAPQKAAAMALMEARAGQGGIDVPSAVNVLGAMVNRAEQEGMPLGEHVASRNYQPTIENAQRARLSSIIKDPAFEPLTQLATKRLQGDVPDWVEGATHFLAPEQAMLKLYQKNPDKYHNWGPFKNSRGRAGRNWTGYDPATGQYQNVVMRDASHAFLKPDGAGPQTPQATRSLPSNQQGKPMYDIMAALARGGKMMGGSGAGLPTFPSAATPQNANQGPMQNLFGSLAKFGPQQEGEQDDEQNQTAMADAQLAASAMQNAGNLTAGNQGSSLRSPRPVDLSQLSTMLQNAGRLGVFKPRQMRY